MKNESVILHRNADSIVLCGTENFAPKRKPNDKHAIQNGDFTKTFTNVDTSDFIVLLTHDPGAFDSVVQKKYPFVALTLSGHTHGAQIGISYKHFSRSLLSLKGGHWGGLYKEGNQYLYINVGFGFNVFPFRIGMPPEITLLTLKHKDEQPIGFK